MKRIVCYLRPHQLEAVKTAAADVGISGMTVTDVRGCGASPEAAAQLGSEVRVVKMPLRSKLEIVAADEVVEAVVEAVILHARTGQSGDGKIFIEPVADAVRIRTEERGDAAV